MSRGVIFDDVTDTSGNALPGISVTIYEEGTFTKATLFDARTGGNNLDNPLTTNERGIFLAYLEPGSYDISVAAPTGTFVKPGVPALDPDDVNDLNENIDDINAALELLDDTGALNALQTVDTLAELPAAADFSGGLRYVKGIGVFESNGSSWNPVELSVTLEQFGGGADKAGAENDAALVGAITHIQSLTTDSRLKGGVIELEYGLYTFDSQIVLPTKIVIVGKGRGASWLVAGSGILNSITGFVQLGESTATAITSCAVRDLTIDATAVSGLKALYSNSINEHCGAFNCLIKSKTATGILVDKTDLGAGAGSPNNFIIEDTEVYVEASNNSIDPVVINIPGNAFRELSNITVIGDFFVGLTTADRSRNGMLITAGSGHIVNYHAEACLSCLTLGDTASAFGIQVDTVTDLGTAVKPWRTCDDVVKITQDTQNFSLKNIKNTTSTNTINDTVLSRTLTAAYVAEYTVSGGSVSQRVVVTSDRATRQKFNQIELQAAPKNTKVQKSSSYTITANDRFIEYTGAGAGTFTFPDALLNDGSEFFVVATSVGALTVQVLGTTSNTFYGTGSVAVTSFVLTGQRLYRFVATDYVNGRWYFTAS